MSKYTTEVRFICESKSGLEDSKGFNDIDTVLANSWDKIFTTQCTFFDEEYREVICKKILKHYYTREIGAETVGLWQLWMNRRLEEIMPYYNQLYSSATLEFDPFEDVDYTTTHTGQSSGRSDRAIAEDVTQTGNDTGTDDITETLTESGTEDVTSTNDHTLNEVTRDLYSDTPQGSLDNVENEHYLTNARKVEHDLSEDSTDTVDRDTTHTSTTVTDRDTTNTSRDVTDRDVTDNTVASSSDSYTDRVFGKRNGYTYSKMLEEFRATMLNIDLMVIDEFADLFMGLW